MISIRCLAYWPLLLLVMLSGCGGQTSHPAPLADSLILPASSRSLVQAGAVYLARAEQNQQVGFIDLQGKPVIPLSYEAAGPFSDGLVAVNQGAKKVDGSLIGGKWGFYNSQGKLVIPIQFEDTYGFAEGLAAVSMQGKWGFINHEGKQVIAAVFDEAGMFGEGLCPVSIQGKWGFIDQQGKQVIPPRFDYVSRGFQNGLAIVVMDRKALREPIKEEEALEAKGKYGLIDRTGKYVVEPTYRMIGDFREGMAKVEVEDPENPSQTKIGYINEQGERIIPALYDTGEDFHEGFAVVGKRTGAASEPMAEGKYAFGYVRKNGQLLTELKYPKLSPFKQGIATVYTRYTDRVFVVVNEQGDVQNAESLPRCGLMDTAGHWMLPDTCQSLEHLGNDRQSHHLFLATRTTRTGTGVITEKGDVVVPFQYADLHYLGNGLLSNNEATGDQVVKVLNLKNEVLIRTKEIDIPASMASFGLLRVITTQQRKTGSVDQHGKWVIPPRFDLIGDFEKVN